MLRLPKPPVTWVSINGAKNAPTGVANGPDLQVTLDIEVAGSVAPEAHIVVYFAPNTEQGFLDAVHAAVADETNHPSIISLSWGGPEINWSTESRMQLDQTFRAAAKRDITVICGDSGASDGVVDGRRHVDFPASSPWVLACGGTRVEAVNNQIRSEVVWNDGDNGGATGGGVSEIFALPDWQSEIDVPRLEDGRTGRGVPDVAANASPTTGYTVFVHGMGMVMGGTAVVAPFWAGLVALLNQGVRCNIGYINPLLYTTLGRENVFRDIVSGNNSIGNTKGYQAGPGWDACTGWGSPDGQKLLEAFRSHIELLRQQRV